MQVGKNTPHSFHNLSYVQPLHQHENQLLQFPLLAHYPWFDAMLSHVYCYREGLYQAIFQLSKEMKCTSALGGSVRDGKSTLSFRASVHMNLINQIRLKFCSVGHSYWSQLKSLLPSKPSYGHRTNNYCFKAQNSIIRPQSNFWIAIFECKIESWEYEAMSHKNCSGASLPCE